MSHNVTEGIQVEDVTFTLDNAREVPAPRSRQTPVSKSPREVLAHIGNGMARWVGAHEICTPRKWIEQQHSPLPQSLMNPEVPNQTRSY